MPGLGRFRDGVAAVENVVKRRFNDRWNPEETRLIAEYLWHITAQPGSGEFAMNSILRTLTRSSPTLRLTLTLTLTLMYSVKQKPKLQNANLTLFLTLTLIADR